MVAYEPQRTATGDFFIWLELMWRERLEALYGKGDDLSDVIVRVAAAERG